MIKKIIVCVLFSSACLAMDWGQYTFDDNQKQIAEAIEEVIDSNDMKSLANLPAAFDILLDPPLLPDDNVYYQETPLLRALRKGSTESVRFLINTKRVNVNPHFCYDRDNRNATYLDILINERENIPNFQEKFDILVNKGVQVSGSTRSTIQTLAGPDGASLRQALGIRIPSGTNSPASSTNNNSPRSSSSDGDSDISTNSPTQDGRSSSPTEDTNSKDEANKISSSGNHNGLKFLGLGVLALTVFYGLTRASEQDDKKDDEENEHVA